MKQYTQYIYKDGEWRVVGASSSSPFPQIHGTLADPIDLRELQTGNYLLSGRILIDDNSYMQTSESGYGTQEIPETLFGVQRDDDYDMYIYVTCDYGNFTYEKNNQDNWDLDECNYYANVNMIKQSDWDQNDNYSIDYIKNRTHYTTENNATTSLPFYLSDSTNNIYSFSGTAANNIIEVNKPEQGKNFKIILNGTSFNEPWAQRSVEIYSEVFYSALYIGNLSLCWYLPSDDPSLDTGESYLFVYLFDETGYCLGGSMWAKASFLSNISGDETKLVPSTIYWPSYHQLDREYLPYEVGNKAEIFNDLEANSASGSFSHAEGSGTYAQGDYAHAEGLLTYAQGDYAHAEGYSSGNLYRLEATISQVYTDPLCFQFEGGELEYNEGWIYNSNGKLIGKDFNFGSYGSYSNVYWIFDDDIKNRDLYENLQVGDTIYIQKSGAYGSYSHTEGHGTFANTGGHAEGESTRANGNFSHAEGNTTIANGGASHAEGHGTNASSYYAHAEGQYTLAGGQSSHAEGEYAENISGKASHVEGISTCTSTGDATHAEGYYSMAIGNSSHAEGSGLSGKSGTIQSINQNNLQITVSGLPEKYGGYKGCMAGTSLSAAQAGKRILNSSYNSSTSQYTFTLKSWNNNYTVGNTIYIYQPTVALDDSAHAEGCGTVAGYNGHSEGALTVASGTGSHAEGLNTEAKGTYQHVQGKYNIVDNNNTYADIIGNGSSDSSRSNAATVDWNGNAWYAGKVTVGSDPTNNMDVATKKYVDDNKGTGTITGVSVNGTSVATSGVANITSVPASILTGAIPSAVTATTQSSGDNSTKIATTAYVDGAITALPEPMIFKGSLGTGGTITSLPSAAASNEGFTYKVITAGTYASQAAKVGDTFISDGSPWVLIPSGDEPSGTVTSITLNATSPIAIDDNTAITSSGTRTLSHANSGVTAGTYKSVTVNATGHVTGGTNPTTISGYGITDAKIASGVITLGSNTITPLTSSSTLDATKLSGTIPSECYTDTKNTAGSTNSSSALYLIGATSQATNPQTYSNSRLYYSSGLHSEASGSGGAVRTNLSQANNQLYLQSIDDGGITEKSKLTLSPASIEMEAEIGDDKSLLNLANGTIHLSTYDDNDNAGEIDAQANMVDMHAYNSTTNKEGLITVESDGTVNISATDGVTITDVVTPTNDTDAVNKAYVDNNSIKTLTSPVVINDTAEGIYKLPSGCSVYKTAPATGTANFTIGRSALLYITHKTVSNMDTVSYIIFEDKAALSYNGSTMELNDIGQILYSGAICDDDGDDWEVSPFNFKIADYLSSNSSDCPLSAKQGKILNENKVNITKTGTNGNATITNQIINNPSDAYDGISIKTEGKVDTNTYSNNFLELVSQDEQTSDLTLGSYLKKGNATKSATISTYVSDNGTSLDNSEIRLGADDIYAAADNNLNISASSLNIGDQYNNTSLNSHLYGDNYGYLSQHGDLEIEGDLFAYATDTSTGDANTISHGQGNISLTAANQSNSTASNLSLNPNGTASLSANSLTISGVVTPTNNTDAANKQYVDNKIRSGTTIPSSSLGNNGDIYIKYSAS